MVDFRDRASPGEIWRPPTAQFTNTVADMVNWFQQQQLGSPESRPIVPKRPDVLLKNTTGGNLALGRVLEVGTNLVTTPSADNLVFNGSTPDPDGTKAIAIILEPALSNDIVFAQMTGLVWCRLNVNHVQHTYADVSDSSTLLQSKWHGRCEIVWKSTASTGEQDAVVRMVGMFYGPIKCVVTQSGGIAAGGSGTVQIYLDDGTAASPSATETGHLKWMEGTRDAEEGAEGELFWRPRAQWYGYSNLECFE